MTNARRGRAGACRAFWVAVACSAAGCGMAADGGGAGNGNGEFNNDNKASWGLNETQSLVVAQDETGEALAASVAGGEFTVVVPAGVARGELALAARGTLDVGSAAAIVGRQPSDLASVAALGGVRLGGQAQVGSIYAGETRIPILLGDQARVLGSVHAASSVQQLGTARVEGTIAVGEHIQGEAYRWRVSFVGESLGNRSAVAGGQPLDLAPGHYGAVTVGPSSSLVVHAGAYAIEGLEVRPGGTLRVDASAGAVYLWVRTSLLLGGIVGDPGHASSLLIGYAGTARLSVSGTLAATLLAPAALVELRPTSAPHAGAVFADAIVVADGASIRHQPFQATTVLATQDELVLQSSALCDFYGCFSIPPGGSSGGPGMDAQRAAQVAICVGDCEASALGQRATCVNEVTQNDDDCHNAVSDCEWGAWSSAFKDIKTVSGALPVVGLNGVMGLIAKITGAGASNIPFANAVYFLSLVQGHIVVDCWPSYDSCDAAASSAYDDCVTTANSNANACRGRC